MDVDTMKKLTTEVAGLMITVPSNLGIFNSEISEIAEIYPPGRWTDVL